MVTAEADGSGDVFWAQKGNSSLMYLNDAGRFVLKGELRRWCCVVG